MKRKKGLLTGLLLALLVLPCTGAVTAPAISDSVWRSRLCVKDGVSDFGNKTFADLFRDAKFQEVVTRDGTTVSFQLEPRSMNGNEAVIDFVMKRNGVESERFTFSFRYMGNYTILYKLTSDRGTVTGADELLKAMRRFYLPCLTDWS
jgi:hypothetical protein